MRLAQAPVSGSKKPAIDGVLIILAAGDEALFSECQVAFDIMGKKSLFLGPVGQGARMKLVVNMVMGAMMGASVSQSVSHPDCDGHQGNVFGSISKVNPQGHP